MIPDVVTIARVVASGACIVVALTMATRQTPKWGWILAFAVLLMPCSP